MSETAQPTTTILGRARRRLAYGLNAGLAIALAFVLAALANYLASRHFLRRDLSRLQFYSLSEKTRQLLGELSNRVDVTVFFQPDHAVYEDVDNLLKEYEQASPWIRVERLDPDRDLARTEELARRYEVTKLNAVVFEHEGRTKFVSNEDIVEMDFSGVLGGEEARPVAFKGEQAFSSALQSLVRQRKPVVYYLLGHGERDLESRDERRGFSRLKQEITRDNLDLRPLTFGEKTGVPDDADALIVAAPRRRISEAEVGLLRKYLERDGRLLILFDAETETGLEPLLEAWGVAVGQNVVVDPGHTLSGYDLFISDYRPHEITRAIVGSTCIFYLPRAVEPLGGEASADRADQPHAQSLCQSSKDSWAEVDADQRPMQFDKGRDFPGPISVAVAVDRRPSAGLDVKVRSARMVVFGDADFVSNAPLSGGNFDFFLSALNWLVDRQDLMAIAPKAMQEIRLLIDASQLRTLFWALVVGLPGAVAVLGVLVWMRRRV